MDTSETSTCCCSAATKEQITPHAESQSADVTSADVGDNVGSNVNHTDSHTDSDNDEYYIKDVCTVVNDNDK